MLARFSTGTYSAGTLTSLFNEGLDGGLASVSGSPVRGVTYNGQATVRFDTNAKGATFTLGVFAGPIFMFSAIANLAVGPTNQGLLGNNWATVNSASFYNGDASGTKMAGYWYDGSSISPGAATSTHITDTGLHGFDVLLGAAVGVFLDGVSLTLDQANTPAAFPAALASGPWTVGRAIDSTPNHTANADVAMLGMLDYQPSADDQLRIEGWRSWAYQNNGRMTPAAHRYQNGPPMLVQTPDGWVAEEEFLGVYPDWVVSDNLLAPAPRRLLIPGWRRAA